MTRNKQQGTQARTWGALLAILVSGAMVLSLSMGATAEHEPQHPDITVEWHEDDMGFDVTSSKDISNVIVEACPPVGQHKHEPIDEKTYTHEETAVVLGIWVKSGDNSDPDGPPGAGERFDNEGAECPVSTSPTPTPTETREPEPCIGPQEIEAHTDGPVNVVNWSAFAGADSYNLYRAESGGEATLLVTTDENTTEYRDDEVTVGTSYTYFATAMVGEEETDACDEVTITAIPVLPSLAAGALAVVGGIGAYAFSRRQH